MLENPTFGWCGITIDTWHISNASYLEDYPILFSDALLWCLGSTEGREFAEDPDEPGRCLVTIDCEGEWWTVGLCPDRLDIWNGEPDFENGQLVLSKSVNDRELREMCTELADDIEGCLHEWTMWGSDASASVDEAGGVYSNAMDYLKRQKELIGLVEELRNA